MDVEITALAALAGQEIVKAMAGDGWRMARDRFAAIFGMGDEKRVARQVELLEASRAELERDSERATALGVRWQDRLEAVLDLHPELADELGTLVAQLREASGGAHTGDHGVAVGGDVHISASDHSAAALRMGSVRIGDPPRPGR